jgi:membrane protease YdiL (CAAX protease family)
MAAMDDPSPGAVSPAEAGFPPMPMDRAAAAADAAVAILVLAALLALPSVLAPLSRGLHVSVPGGWYLWAVASGLLILAAVLLLLRRRGQALGSIGLGRAPAGRVVLAAGGAVLLCYLFGIVSSILVVAVTGGDLEGLARQKQQLLQAVGTIPLGLVVPMSLFVGLYEEVFIRGFLLSRLMALSRGTLVPVVVSSVVFGAAHYSQGLAGVAQTAAIGLALGLVVVRAGTLWPAILAHATIDSVSLTLAVLFREQLRAGG